MRPIVPAMLLEGLEFWGCRDLFRHVQARDRVVGKFRVEGESGSRGGNQNDLLVSMHDDMIGVI